MRQGVRLSRGSIDGQREYRALSDKMHGRVVPVLDLMRLIAECEVRSAEQNTKLTIKETQIPENPQKQNSAILSVLIVDDSPSVRHLNTKLIKSAGWQAVIAKDGLEALDILQAFEEKPDIILTDVEMPRMNGYEMLSALKQNDVLREIPVIMITSRAGEKHRQKAFDLGVSEYLAKPYEDRKLLESIRRLTERK